MAKISVKCPKCDRFIDFDDAKLFGFCPHCASKIERSPDGSASVYDPGSETDEFVLMTKERFDACSRYKAPRREEMDLESFDDATERLMDILMSFTETQKDVISSTEDLPADRKLRVRELCYGMVIGMEKQFSAFLEENREYGLYDEFRSIIRTYENDIQSLSGDIQAEQRKRHDDYWSQHPERYAQLKADLKDTMQRKTKLAFFDFQGKWACDAEIAKIQEELNRTSD